MKKGLLSFLLSLVLIGHANNLVSAETLPIVSPDLNIHMPDAVFTSSNGDVFRVTADFDFVGVSEGGTLLWEVKPDGYSFLSNTTKSPPEEIGCISADQVAAGEVRTLHNNNNGVDYIVNCVFAVRGDLIIDPGVTIQFSADAGIKVHSTGSMQANGTTEQPVLLTGEDKVAGSWRGIHIQSKGGRNSLQYIHIDYAGGRSINSNTTGDKGAVVILGGTHLSMSNATIRHSANFGVNANYAGSDLSLKDTIITASKVPMLVRAAYPDIISGGEYTGNETDAIVVVDDQITGKHNWTNLGVPYRITNKVTVIDDGQLTIQPGVILEFEFDGSLEVREGLSGMAPRLIALGTEEEPITFTAVNKVLRSWRGVVFDTSSSLNQIGFATIAYASNSRQEGAIFMLNEPVLDIHDVSFEHIQNCAIYAAPTFPNPKLSTLNLFYDDVGDEQCGN